MPSAHVPTSRTGQAVPRPVDDPLVRACATLTAFAVGWFLLALVHPIGPPALLWVTAPFYGPVVGLVFWRAGRSPGMNEASRLFWMRVSPAPLMVGCGHVAQAVDILRNPDIGGSRTGPVMLAFDACALLLVSHALVRLPASREDRRNAVRIMLDTSTVMLASAAYIWHFGTRRDVAGLTSGTAPDGLAALGAAATSLVLMVLASFCLFAMVRAMMSNHRVLDRTGLRFFAIAIAFSTVLPLLHPVFASIDPDLYPAQVSLPITFLFGALAGAHQRHAAVAPRRRGTGRFRRPFSLMPYTAVAAVDALLLWVACTDRDDIVAVAVVAVILTVVVVGRQITALRENGRLVARLEHNATHDALTGLANRVLFQRRLRDAVAPRNDAGGDALVGVALIDLDDFKEVNDTLGHEVGDLLLVQVAERLAGCLRSEHTAARLGGDEFVIVMPDTSPDAADGVVAAVVAALDRPFAVERHTLSVHASVGIADGCTGDEPSLLLRRADIAMYAAKAVPGTSSVRFRPDIVAEGANQIILADELRAAIAGDQLFLLYQPIVDLSDGRVVGAEALVRWAHPGRGVLAPDAFVPFAERSELIVALGRWVVRTALRQLAEWPPGADGPPARLSINLSAIELREPDLAATVADLLRRYEVAPQRITFEVTESVALRDPQAVTTLQELRGLGVRISLDDFGTGYSTLSLLSECPVDEIKLDRAFTQASTDGTAPMATVVIQLARALGLHAVAEGVETGEQARYLRSLGYPTAQGYHFARPLPPEHFDQVDGAPRPRDGVPMPRR